MTDNNLFWESLEKNLPDVFPRKEVHHLTSGFICGQTLANLDCLGQGPSVKVRIGKFVGYEKTSFIKFLQNRATASQTLATGKSKKITSKSEEGQYE